MPGPGSKTTTEFAEAALEDEEDKRVARILSRIIYALLAAYLVVIVTSVYWQDWDVILVALLGGLWLLVPLGLLLRGYLRLGGVIVVVSVLWMATIFATFGQGIHDIAVFGYPVIIVIAGLTLGRREFVLSSFLTLGALAWLVFGALEGFYIPQNFDPLTWVDFVPVAVIMLVVMIAADWLAVSTRENYRRARQEIAHRKELEAQLRYLGSHDGLTGVYNRAFFEAELDRLGSSREFPVSILIADLDGLKGVNDTRGHAAGDELLRRASALLGRVFRAGDVLARIGGDEFAVLLPRTDSAAATQVMARIGASLKEQNGQSPDRKVKLSVGAATAVAGDLTRTFVVADQRMYADKAARKSKLVLASPSRPRMFAR